MLFESKRLEDKALRVPCGFTRRMNQVMNDDFFSVSFVVRDVTDAGSAGTELVEQTKVWKRHDILLRNLLVAL